jgi:hypothetical protein
LKGRKGVEFLTNALKDLISGKIKNIREFLTKLSMELKKVAMDAVKSTTKYVPNVMIINSAKP